MAKSKAEQAQVAARRVQLIKLRRAGVRFDDHRILDLGYATPGAASKDMIRALKQNRDEQDAEASIYRQENLERLEALLESVWPDATSGDLKANEQARKIIVDIIDMRGIKVPVRTEISGPDGGAVPLGSGALDELNKLIGIAGQTGPVNELTAEDAPGDDSDG